MTRLLEREKVGLVLPMDKKEVASLLNTLMRQCASYHDWDPESYTPEENIRADKEYRWHIFSAASQLANALDLPVGYLPFCSEWPIFTYDGSSYNAEMEGQDFNKVVEQLKDEFYGSTNAS